MRPPGMPKTGGRKKGVPNKVTSATREAFLAVFEKFQSRGDLERWITETGDGREAKGDKPAMIARPDRAAELLLKYAEFSHPKAKPLPQEVTGADGEPLTIQIIKYGQEGA